MPGVLDSQYIPSPFNIIEPDPNNRQTIVIKNLMTEKVFKLQNKEVGSPLGNTANKKWLEFLISEKLIVKPKDIELAITERLDQLMYGFPENEARAVYIPGYKCQLKCDYCYNAEARECESDERLDDSTLASQYIDFYKNTPAKTWVLIITGGGEPLLYIKNILAVAGLIKDEAGKQGCKLNLNIITNGELLSKANVKQLCAVGLKQVGVTIDPDHDNSRPAKDGKPKKDSILNNFFNLPKSVNICISSNIKEGQKESYKELLLTDLAPLNGRIKSVRANVQCNPIIGDSTSKPEIFSRLYTKRMTELTLEIMQLIDSAGFERNEEKDGLIDCEAFKDCEAFVSDAAGNRSFCPGLINIDKYKLNPLDASVENEYDLRLKNQPWREHCFKNGLPCSYLLKCFGGCRFISITQGASWGTINCEKLFLDSITRYNMRRWALRNGKEQ